MKPLPEDYWKKKKEHQLRKAREYNKISQERMKRKDPEKFEKVAVSKRAYAKEWRKAKAREEEQ